MAAAVLIMGMDCRVSGAVVLGYESGSTSGPQPSLREKKWGEQGPLKGPHSNGNEAASSLRASGAEAHSTLLQNVLWLLIGVWSPGRDLQAPACPQARLSVLFESCLTHRKLHQNPPNSESSRPEGAPALETHCLDSRFFLSDEGWGMGS